MPTISGCQMAAMWKPAEAFGGDCYDVIQFSDTHVGLSIADVAGKGLPAALLMANLQASVRALATMDASPQHVTRDVNQALCRHTPLDRFVTFFYAALDTARKTLVCSNAGHNPPILVRADGTVCRPTSGGMVLGVFDSVTYTQDAFDLQSSDRLVLFTDGISECESPDGVDFGDERLVQTIVAHRHESAGALLDTVFRHVNAFTGGRLIDDATVITVAVE
jgi:sigma-B regulation protein RsbU (phosphoserine phosphatase)